MMTTELTLTNPDLPHSSIAEHSKPMSDLQRDLICGSFSGAACWLIGHPLDSIKVRMQTANAASKPTLMGTI